VLCDIDKSKDFPCWRIKVLKMENYTSFPVPARALVITPHPDDSELGCGGAVVTWIKQGTEVVYLLCTNGDKGSSDPEMTSPKLAELRKIEQQKAAEILGVLEVVRLDYEDGSLEDTPFFRGQIVKVIRRFKPDVVLFTDPLRTGFYLHRDHRIAGSVALDALFPYARDRLHYPEHESEGLLPHKTSDALMWGSESPDTFIDITTSIDKKIEALAAHKTQIPSGEESYEFADLIKGTASRIGDRCGYKYAEGFRRISFSV
jgi:LmbE family N-acetylglucosaminyl deacetylase